MIIGLAGYARSGKDTAADVLVEKHGFVKYSFADPMREALKRLDPHIQVNDIAHLPLSQALRIYSWEQLKVESPDIRGLLQRMGTEVGRSMFGTDFWVDYAVNSIPEGTNVVFSDVRFQNEANKILALGGRVWRIEREGAEAANSHISEHDLDEFPFELVIQNDFSLEQLSSNIDTALSFDLASILRNL